MSLPAFAAPKLQTFHIEAGDATLTLTEFSRQSSLQLLFDYNVVRGRKTRPVIGELEPAAALKEMLADTGLAFDFVNERTLAITQSERPKAPGSAVAEPASAHRHTRAATDTQSVAHEAGSAAGGPQAARASVLEEITILGTHVRGEEPVGEHVVHYGRRDIEDSPAGTVQDFLRTFPQTFGGGPTEDTHYFSAETETNSGLGSGVNLRGLGAKATLVLINGKRMAPSGTDAAFSDIENIPLAAVDRVDILSDGASALYGSDAIGGVVNFVMRDNFTGNETLLRGGPGSRNTLAEYQAAETVGQRWDSGNAMVSLEFYKRAALPSYTRQYANSDLTLLGGSNFDAPNGNPGTLSVGGQTYAIPRGQDGTHLSAADLLPGENLYNRYQNSDILPSQTRWSLYSSGKQALSDNVSLFGNALVSRREAQLRNGGISANLTVTDANPFYVNPAGGHDPVTVNYNFLEDLGSSYNDVIVNNFNLTLGLNIEVGAAWKLTLYGNYAQEKENQFTGGLVDPVAYNAALLDTNPGTALDPFGDGSHTNPATLKSIETSSRYYTNSRLRTADLTADGPIAHLPGGDMKLAVGVDRRNQVYATVQSASSLTPAISIEDARNVTAAFGEIRVPVFGKENGQFGFRRLELSVAGRYEHYSDFGDATTPKIGLAWSPLELLAVRGTWGRSIRAPTLADLDTRNNFIVSGFLPDSASPAGFSRVLLEVGKNPSLTVERARTWTAGFDLNATKWISGLSLSATYFNIRFRDRIQAPSFDVSSVLNDPTLSMIVTRNPSAALVDSVCSGGLYVSPGGGNCTQVSPNAVIDLRSTNLASVTTSGIDLNAIYERSWAPGTLRFRLDGTYLLDFTQQTNPGAPDLQLLNTQNNPIDIKLRGVLSWQQRWWGASVGINFQDHYKDVVSIPNRNIRSYTTFDAQLRYAPPVFGTSLLQNTELDLNASNVFNSSPPFLNNATAFLGYDQENADPYGRMVSIQVRKSW